MSFCSITSNNLKNLTILVFAQVKSDPTVLKSFKKFTQNIVNDLVRRNVPIDKAIGMASYVPQIIQDYNTDKINRLNLKQAGISMDDISAAEGHFESYESLAKYIGIKNESTPLVVVNDAQMVISDKVRNLTSSTTVEFEGDTRKVNGKVFSIRVTNIAKSGYDAPFEDEDNPALKHGNTVDGIAKSVFDDGKTSYSDFESLMSENAYNSLVSKLREVKRDMEQQGFVFHTGVTVFNQKLGVAGEIDLVAVNSNGEVYILDFKTANQRFNEQYLRNTNLKYKSDNVIHDVSILSKWSQYATQGYIYARMLSEQLGVPFVNRIGIIGININYDASTPAADSKIEKLVEINLHSIPFSDVRQEYRGKDVVGIIEAYKEVEGKELGTLTEVKVIRKGSFPHIKPRGKLDRIAYVQEVAATDAEMKKEVDWFLSSPIRKGTLLIMDEYINAGLFGNFQLDAITVFKNASKGTLYHEGWHRFSQVFMTVAQKGRLYDSVREDAIKFTARDGRKLNTKTADPIDIEEFLAEEFAKFALNPEKYNYPRPNPEPKNLFERIWEFLTRYFGDNPRPIELFQKLYSGKVSYYTPSVNNAVWGNLNSIAENHKGEEIIPNERFPLYKETMDRLLGEALDKEKKSFVAFKQSKTLQKKALNYAFDLLREMWETDPNLTEQHVTEIKSILDNSHDFTKAWLKATSYDTLKSFPIDEKIFTDSSEELAILDDLGDKYDMPDEENLQDEEPSSAEKFGTQPGNEVAAHVMEDTVQDMFRGIAKVKKVNQDGSIEYVKNELGIKVNHSYYDVFYRTKRMLSGAFTMPDMLERMKDKKNQWQFPELKEISDKIESFIKSDGENNFYRRIQNMMFVQSFYHIMSMPEVNNMQLTENFKAITQKYKTFTPIAVSFRVATRNLSMKIIKGWEKDFKDRRHKDYISYEEFDKQRDDFFTTPLYKTEDGKIMLNPFADWSKVFPERTLEGVKKFWETMGVSFNPKVWFDADAVKEINKGRFALQNNLNTHRKGITNSFLADLDEAMASLVNDGSIEIDMDELTSIEQYIKYAPDYLIDLLVKKYFIGNPTSFFNDKRNYEYEQPDRRGVLTSKKDSTDAIRYVYEQMAAIEEKYGDRISSGAFRIEDKTKYPYYIPNFLLTSTELLNQAKTTSDISNSGYISYLDPNIHPWMRRSFFMRSMFNSDGVRLLDENGKSINIELGDMASVVTRTDEGSLEKHPRSLNVDEKFFSDILSLFKAGALEISRAEGSSTIFYFKLSSYGENRTLPIQIEEVLRGVPETFHDMVKEYFLGEVEKRQWWMKNDPKVTGATTNPKTGKKIPLSKQFNIFESILSPDLKKKIEKHLDKKADAIFLEDGIHKQFREDVEAYFDKLLENIRPKFNTLSPDQKAMLLETLGAPNIKSMYSVSRAFVMNQFILNMEFQNLYFGDLYFYKNPFKRGKLVTNTGALFFIDEHRNAMLNSVQNSTLHSILTGMAPGGKDFSSLKTAIIKDVEMKSTYVDDDDNQNILLKGVMEVRVAAGLLTAGTKEYADEVAKIKKTFEKYNAINIADGQGLISLDFYRNFSIVVKIWSEEKEKEYERQKAIFRSHFNLYFELDENGNKIPLTGEKLAEAKQQDKDLIATKTGGYFNPLKVSYTGPQKKDGPIRPVFDKFAVRVMLPETAIGRRDENMLLEMVKGDIDYLKFQSGTKVYQDSVFDWYKQISDGKYNMEDFSAEEIEPNLLYSAYFKHQLSTEGFKEEYILGSQFRKIVFGIKYVPAVRNNKALLEKFTRLEQEFNDTVRNLIQVEQNDLFSLLGIDVINGKYKVQDMKKFLKLLTDESIKRGVAINNIDYIQYNEATKNAKYPMDYAFNRQQIQDLLSGLIDERLRRLKVNSSSLIQVSSAGFESQSGFKNATLDDRRKYGTTGLHYYHMISKAGGSPIRTSTMGIKVSLMGEYKSLLKLPAPASLGENLVRDKVTGALIEDIRNAGKIDTLERLNKAMQDKEWKDTHMKKFLLVGYRIPTQNNNFIDHMEIMEFLPEAAGAIIIAPIELIVKSGSDFDIDKMNVIRPSFDRNTGHLIKAPAETLSEINEEIKKLTFEERDAKAAKRELAGLLAGAALEKDRLMLLQRKIRRTIMDLAIKSSSGILLDRVMDNIVKGKEEVVPEDLLDPTDRDLFEATIKYVAIDNEINRISAGYKILNDEKGNEQDMKWFKKKTDYKKSQNNRMVDILSETLSDPTYFESLVTPSTTELLDDLVNRLIASTQNMTAAEYEKALKDTGGKIFDKVGTPAENSQYNASLNAFDNLLSKAKDLGGYAIQRTFADIFNYAKFSIAQTYAYNLRGESVNKRIFVPLMPPSVREKKVQNGRISLHGESVSGIPIKDAFDQLISLTVDLANSPAYPYIGIKNYTKKHAQFLIHEGNDPEQVVWFLNQPILKELYGLYENQRRKISGYTLKHAMVELALRKKVLQNTEKWPGVKTYEVLEMNKIPAKYDMDDEKIEGTGVWVANTRKADSRLARPFWEANNYLNDTDYFSFEEMDKAIRDNDTSTPLQRKVLAYFISMTEEADEIMKVQFSNNVDTNKYATLTSLMRLQNNRQEIRSKSGSRTGNLFDEKQLDIIEKQSIISPFDYTKKAYDIHKALFPHLYTERSIGMFSRLVSDVFGARNVEIERISKIIENDWIEYIYKNYGTYNGKNLSDHFESQLINTDSTQDHEYFSYKFLDLTSEFPELLEIPFVEKMYEDIYTPPDDVIKETYKRAVDEDKVLDIGMDNREIRNLFFLRNPDNPTNDKNLFTGNWRNLINFSPERLGLNRFYSEEQVAKISSFFHELIYFSLYQSGLTNTGNGFSDLIPYEHWAHFIQSAFDNYEKEKGMNDQIEREMLEEFAFRVRQMNPKIPWRTTKREIQDYTEEGRYKTEPLAFFKNYYRGKHYRVTDDDLMFSRDFYLSSDEKLEQQMPLIHNPQSSVGSIGPGSHVRFGDRTYIVVKETKNANIWQLYDPLLEGRGAKLAAPAKNLTVLSDKSNVVVYGQKSYIVTQKEEIIDLGLNKKMTWDKKNQSRINILELAKKQKDELDNPISPDNLPPIEPDCN